MVGQVALHATAERMRELQRSALERIAPERRRQLVDLLNELARALDDTSS